MNPPFSKGVDHLLHAWEILKEGHIACLLNAETILNPSSKKREVLKKIIEAHGSVEYLTAAFSEAERKTNVEIALVRLCKKNDVDDFDFLFDGLGDVEQNMKTEYEEISKNLPMQANEVKNLIDIYNVSKKEFSEYLKHAQSITYIISHLIGNDSHYADKALEDLMTVFCPVNSTKEQRKEQYNEYYSNFVDYAREKAWKKVFSKSNLDKYMTKKVREDFTKFQGSSINGQFTIDNIQKFCNNVFANKEKILTESILESFDLMVRYHEGNDYQAEGWKTDKAWKVGKKVIIPYVVSFDWSGYNVNYGYRRDMLMDMNKGLCMLAGKNFDNIVTIFDGLQKSFKAKEDRTAESEFFTMKYYKKGTLHLTFKDLKLLERFNQTVAKLRGWLPKDFK